MQTPNMEFFERIKFVNALSGPDNLFDRPTSSYEYTCRVQCPRSLTYPGQKMIPLVEGNSVNPPALLQLTTELT